MLIAQGPPATPQDLPQSVWGTGWQWLQNALYVSLAVSIIAVIVLGALLAVDKNRGEAVSATSPTIAALKIALGVMIASSAVTIASWFV
ncbi:hypothetical protein NQ042_10580 [Corynebacterium phoceense]|uniref:hypothetical protein n=1 Tax=Corynebacterium phoceense TaxID=1686286 RepID=UPI00211CEB66|nr:hypothetical protein [Corynebacterium phoceense]